MRREGHVHKVLNYAVLITAGALASCDSSGAVTTSSTAEGVKQVAEDPAIGDVTQRVRKVIAELLGASIDSVRDDADFVDDLGADSLDCLELVMGLEKEFGIEIPDEDVEKLKTIRQMVEYVVGRQKARMATS